MKLDRKLRLNFNLKLGWKLGQKQNQIGMKKAYENRARQLWGCILIKEEVDWGRIRAYMDWMLKSDSIWRRNGIDLMLQRVRVFNLKIREKLGEIEWNWILVLIGVNCPQPRGLSHVRNNYDGLSNKATLTYFGNKYKGNFRPNKKSKG